MNPIVCLTMIVRDEAHVIERCLAPIRKYLDRYVILDTGSTDATKALAAKALDGIPGTIADFAWVDDYSAARNRALELAEQATAGRPAYAWIVDADDVWDAFPAKERLTAPGYAALSKMAGGSMPQTRLLRLGDGWRYRGVLHEVPVIPGREPSPSDVTVIGNWIVTSPEDGATSKDPEKFLRRVEILQKALAVEPPGDLYARYLFYIAESYREAGDDARAAMHFAQRAYMHPRGDRLETYRAYLEAGRALIRINQWDEAERILNDARSFAPDRMAPAFELGRLLLLRTAITQPGPGDVTERLPMDLVRQTATALYGLESL